MQRDTDNALMCYRQSDIVQNEVYSTSVEIVQFSKDEFHKIGNSFYPDKSLTNRIAAAAGVEFLSAGTIKEVYGDIEIIGGVERRPIVGYMAYRQGRRRRPDGTWQISNPCNYEFNWMDRAEEDFLKDAEKVGQTYSDGNSKAKYHDRNGNPNNVAQRKHILDLKRKANRMASTGAALAVIRELIAMPTGWTAQDLSAGAIKVTQIAESRAFQKAKAQAEIRGIESGKSNVGRISELLGEDSFSQNFERPTAKPAEPIQEETEEPTESMESVYKREYAQCVPEFQAWLDDYMGKKQDHPDKYELGLAAIEKNNYGRTGQ